jgi:TM2 domain-containing membrane protein YozV
VALDDPFQNPQNQQMQQQPMYQGNAQQVPGADKKMIAGILGIAMGVLGLGFGVHKFILGYKNEGLIMLAAYFVPIALTIVSCGILFPLLFITMIPGIIGIIEGIIYLTKSDEEFVQTYIVNKKPWF